MKQGSCHCAELHLNCICSVSQWEQRSFARAHIKHENQEKDSWLLGQGQLGEYVWHGFSWVVVWKLLVAEVVMLGKGKGWKQR